MKYIILLCDGMADLPVPELDEKTPMECSHTPVMDRFCQLGEVGLAITVPEGMPPGSDVANLSVFGYNPRLYYTGRSPLEAASLEIPLSCADITYRANLVTLVGNGEYEDKIMKDYSSDEITTDESRELIAAIDKILGTDKFEFHSGMSYRHIMVSRRIEVGLTPNDPAQINCKDTSMLCKNQTDNKLIPPHDILDKGIKDYLPHDDELLNIMKRSFDILENHPINQKRVESGLNPANSLWLWGSGNKPALKSFRELYGKEGAVISAVDLIKGIGKCAGLKIINVEGATGTVHTNWEGKANAAISALAEVDFVYIHIEAADEAGHRHEVDNKIKAIELIDSKILLPLTAHLEESGQDYRILIIPDHPTPLILRTHTSDPVPYILYDSTKDNHSGAERFTEKIAADTGVLCSDASGLITRLLENN